MSSAVGARIEAPKGAGCGNVPLPTGEGSGEGAVPPPQKNFDFVSQYGEFWCVLGGIFVAVQLPVLYTKRYNLVPFPIIFILFFSLQIGFPFPLRASAPHWHALKQ